MPKIKEYTCTACGHITELVLLMDNDTVPISGLAAPNGYTCEKCGEIASEDPPIMLHTGLSMVIEDFNYPPTCDKCKSTDIVSRYFAAGPTHHRSIHYNDGEIYPEHLRKTCEMCGYVWFEYPYIRYKGIDR